MHGEHGELPVGHGRRAAHTVVEGSAVERIGSFGASSPELVREDRLLAVLVRFGEADPLPVTCVAPDLVGAVRTGRSRAA